MTLHFGVPSMPNIKMSRSKPTANSSAAVGSHAIFLPSPVECLPSPTAASVSLPKLSTPAFFAVMRFHNRMLFSPLLTLIMSFMLGCTAKSLTPEGAPPIAAVSPLGRPNCLGMGTLMLLRTVMSRILVTAIVESSLAEMSLPFVGNASLVTVELWCSRAPTSRFLEFSRILRGAILESRSCSSFDFWLGKDLQRVAGYGDLIKLTELIISKCPELEELPSLSRLSFMENIKIDSCDKLQNITLPKTLISLSVHSCRGLQRASGSGDLIKLTKLIISECPELEELPSFSRVSCVEMIKVDCCEKLQNITLPATLISLNVHNCRDLRRVVGYGDLIKLTELIIIECPELGEFPILSRLSYLEKIEIDSSEKLERISGIEELRASEYMKLCYCSNAVIQNCIHKLKSVPKNLSMIGRAVVRAESSLNECLFSDAHIGADGLIDVLAQNSTKIDITAINEALEVSRGAVIRCYVVVVDSSTSVEDINKFLQLCYDDEDIHQTWPNVREGEWIITMLTSGRFIYEFSYYAEVFLDWKGIMKKGFRVEVNKGEESKCLGVLDTIVDKLHQ